MTDPKVGIVKKIVSGSKNKDLPNYQDGTKAFFHFKVEALEEDGSTSFIEVSF